MNVGEELRDVRGALGVELDAVARAHLLEEPLDIGVAEADATVGFREAD